MTDYVELQVTTNFTFLTGASHPEEMAAAAAALGHRAIAVTDRNTLAGVVRAHLGAREAGIRLLVGARLDLEDAPSLLCFPTDRVAYGRLARLLTLGKRRTEKGQCRLVRADVLAHGEGQVFVVLPPDDLAGIAGEDFADQLRIYARAFAGRCYLAGQHLYRGDDGRRLASLAALATETGAPLVATNDVHAHAPERRPLMDVLTCIREHCTIHEAGHRLAANAERHLKPAAEMARLFRGHEDALARTLEIAERCRFSLEELRYDYPVDPVPDGRTPDEELARLAWAGADERYPDGVPDKVRTQIAHELELVAELRYAPYFLTVHDIVRFARSRGILCQGRGSAANSAVCYCLGITAVDPAQLDLLFERFVSAERNEPPDIDVDFEHERREEVIQYIYAKYGRARAGLAATVISYRARSAVREVGKAMGLSEDTVGALAGQVWGRSSEGLAEQVARELGLDPTEPTLARVLALTRELIGFPRHLSQHVGGFVITKGRLDEMVPIENAAMEDRTVIEWDKNDLDALGILKIDVLGLGMLTCIRKGFDLLARHHGRRLDLATVPAEAPAVYDMLCNADSLGVFQVESRAQMAFLPRMKPRGFYDLVIEVAIVRPGPIQGDMVHPYLRRRNGEERVTFPSPELEEVLGKTLGVPLFQEQAMKIAIVAAGFTPAEADRLRRAMATFRHTGTIHTFRDKLVEGMAARGYERGFAERCFHQIEGFGEYGFPESHAASFALLVYVSAWFKCYYPEVFACALLNSQPMGFYAPAQIVRDARQHGVEVRGVDVNHSHWDCTLEAVGGREITTPPTPPLPDNGSEAMVGAGFKPAPTGPAKSPSPSMGEDWVGVTRDKSATRAFALRLGLRQIKGFREEDAEAIAAAREPGYADPRALWRRAGVSARALAQLAEADAFASMGLARREAIWAVRALGAPPPPLFAAAEAQGRTVGAGFKPAPTNPAIQQETPSPLVREGGGHAISRARWPTGGEAPPGWSRETTVALPAEQPGEAVANDYAALRLSLKHHPMKLLRAGMARRGAVASERLMDITPDRKVTVAGLVLVRQRPGSAKGVIFATLEDETGTANVIVWPDIFERFRRVILSARLLFVEGVLQREGIVAHVIARRLVDLSHLLDELADGAGPAHPGHPPADAVTHPSPPDPRAHPRRAQIRVRSRDFH
ncbi:MAG: error-prone DNA polymerase [Alphaproteobacteria bacterium]